MVKALQLHAAAAVILASFLFVGLPAAHADNPGEAWSRLTPEQKTILAPLQPEWDKTDPELRKHWLGLASRYPGLPAERQQSIKQRMHEWAALTPEQRAQAVERYKRIKQLPTDKHQRLQRWREYQALPEEQRQQLRSNPPGK